MPDIPYIAGLVLIPLGFGLIPAFLPRRLPIPVRWCLWLALLAMSAWYVASLQGGQVPFPQLALACLALSSAVSLYVLIVETRRAKAARDSMSARKR